MSSDELPIGWAEVPLSDVAEVRLGRQRSPSKAFGERMRPYVRAANVGWEGLKLDDVLEMAFTEQESASYELQPGDLLLSEASGSPSEVGKPAIWRGEIPGCCFQNTLIRVRPREVLSEYLLHFFLSTALNGDFARGSRGVGIRHLGGAALTNWPVRIPPLREQARIVEVIETAFSQLDAATAYLRAAKRRLATLRRRVIELAASGGLTDVRSQLGDVAEVEYREYVSAKPDPFQEVSLPVLRAGWQWVQAASACEAIESGGTPQASLMSSGEGEIPFIKVYNLTTSGALDFSIRPTFIGSETHRRQKRSSAIPGDVLTNIVGPPLGKVAIVPDTYPEWNMNQAVVMFRPGSGVDSRFLSLLLQSRFVMERLERTSKATAGQFNVSLTACRYLPLPLPPISTQKAVRAQAERLLSHVDGQLALMEVQLARGQTLRRAILDEAISGKLVTQDPFDEPAKLLIDRIAPSLTDKRRSARAPHLPTVRRGASV